jgi:hypothetical protein
MKPSSPIIPGEKLPETIYAKNQPEYQPLPVLRDEDGTVLSRWHCTWRERLRILITGDVYLWQLTFNQPLQPVNVEASAPKMEGKPKHSPVTRLGRRIFKSALHAMSNKNHFDEPEPKWALAIWRCRNYVPRSWWAY